MHRPKKVLVLGAAGFIGGHLVARLKQEGFHVRAVDRVRPPYRQCEADEFILGDLCDPATVAQAMDQPFDEVYQLAAEMGGAGYIFSGQHDFDIFSHSARINLNVVEALDRIPAGRVLFSSSACVYNQFKQTPDAAYHCREEDAYPAWPDSEYGWEKLFAERLYGLLGARGHTQARIIRFHNVYGPYGAWTGGREKAPAAICRKVAEAADSGQIEIWGDGRQLRSFLFIEDALDGMIRAMRSDVAQPLNIGSDECISIRELAELAIGLSGKSLSIACIEGPQGVAARSSDNALVTRSIGWSPRVSLRQGLGETYPWIAQQVASR
jgi:nucleoside-diphosphate-sugar epimerase